MGKKLIYADDLMDTIRDDEWIDGRNFAIMHDHIKGAKAVDAVEVIHGHWNRLHFVTEIPFPDKYICSECQSILHKEFNYCPECGADMRGNDNFDKFAKKMEENK